jgi:hypothetical protein
MHTAHWKPRANIANNSSPRRKEDCLERVWLSSAMKKIGTNDSLLLRDDHLHHIPTSRRRRRKGNPVPGGITGRPSSWGIKIRRPGPTGWGSLESETVKYGHEFRGTRTREWLRWREPTAIINNESILSSEKMLHKGYNRKRSVKKYRLWFPRCLAPRRTDWR